MPKKVCVLVTGHSMYVESEVVLVDGCLLANAALYVYIAAKGAFRWHGT